MNAHIIPAEQNFEGKPPAGVFSPPKSPKTTRQKLLYLIQDMTSKEKRYYSMRIFDIFREIV
jgi:hypothetical protein